MTRQSIDPATLAVLQNALSQIVNEMDLALEEGGVQSDHVGCARPRQRHL